MVPEFAHNAAGGVPAPALAVSQEAE